MISTLYLYRKASKDNARSQGKETVCPNEPCICILMMLRHQNTWQVTVMLHCCYLKEPILHNKKPCTPVGTCRACKKGFQKREGLRKYNITAGKWILLMWGNCTKVTGCEAVQIVERRKLVPQQPYITSHKSAAGITKRKAACTILRDNIVKYRNFPWIF